MTQDLSPQALTFAPRTSTSLTAAAVNLSAVDATQPPQPTAPHMSTFAALAPVSPAPVTTPPAVDPVASFLVLPATIFSTATSLFTAVLSSFVAPAPGTPANPPLVWAVLEIVRREFFNQTPQIAYTASKPDALGNITISLNQTDADGDTLAYTATDGAKGAVALNPDGHSFTYTPNPGETGTDTITVTANDDTSPHIHGLLGLINALSFGLLGDRGNTATTTVTVTLNTPPTLAVTPGVPDATTGKVTVTAVATDADGDALTLSVGTPANGTVSTPTLTDAATGTYTFSYTPTDTARHAAAADNATPADKSDTVTVSVNDGHGAQVTNTVNVAVAPADNAPAFSMVSSSTDSAGKVTGTVVFTDADNDTLTYSGSGDTGKGSVVVDSTGGFTYTPTSDARFEAAATDGADTDTFTVTVKDGHGGTVTQTLTVTVKPAEITSDGTAALTAAESVIDQQVSDLASAKSSLSAYIASLGVTVSAAKMSALTADIQARDALVAAGANESVINSIDDRINQQLNVLGLTQAQFDTINKDATAVIEAQVKSRALETAADARAVVAGDTAGDGKPVLSRVEWTSQADGAVTGTAVFIAANNDPLVYQATAITAPVISPGEISFSTTQPGVFTFTPSVLPINYKGPISFTLFVTDNTNDTVTVTSITIDNTKNGVTQGTITATSGLNSSTSLADLEQAIAASDASFNTGIVDRQAAIEAANDTLVAQKETAMLAAQQQRAEAMEQFVAGVLSGAINI